MLSFIDLFQIRVSECREIIGRKWKDKKSGKEEDTKRRTRKVKTRRNDRNRKFQNFYGILNLRKIERFLNFLNCAPKLQACTS